MNCIACNKQTNTDCSMRCVACGGSYHYQCLGMTKTQFVSNQHTSLKRSWRCPSCTNITRRRDDNTPVRKSPAITALLNDTCMSCDESSLQGSDASYHNESVAQQQSATQPGTSASHADLATITYAQFGELLDQKLMSVKESLTHELKATIRSEINCAIKKYESEFNHSIEFLSGEQKDFKVAMDAAQTKIKSIEAEKADLQTSLQKLERRLSTIERTSRSHNLEIHSVPEKNSEDLYAILKNLGDHLKIDIPYASAARRISKFNKSNDRPRNILVTLPSERLRDSIIAAFKKYNRFNSGSPLNSSHLGVPGEPFRVFVVEHLSPECKELYAEARKFAKDNQYRFTWVKYGRIYIRKDEGSSPILVKSKDSLSNLH